MSPVLHRLNGRELTCDHFYHRKVSVYQPRFGWRFSVDAPVLAHFIKPPVTGSVVEIGGGCGIVSLLLLWKGVVSRLKVYEIQRFYARLCSINARINGKGSRMEVICGDYLANESRHAPAGLIFTNPPFFLPNRGRVSPNQEIALAKWEIRLPIDSLLETARERLAADGRLAMILPSQREREYRQQFSRKGFWMERYQEVRPFPDGKTERILVQLTTEHAVEERLAPLILFSGPGKHSAEMSAIMKGQ